MTQDLLRECFDRSAFELHPGDLNLSLRLYAGLIITADILLRSRFLTELCDDRKILFGAQAQRTEVEATSGQGLPIRRYLAAHKVCKTIGSDMRSSLPLG